MVAIAVYLRLEKLHRTIVREQEIHIHHNCYANIFPPSGLIQ